MTTYTHAHSVFASPSHRPTGLIDLVVACAATWRQRKALSKLDAHLLADIGISATMAEKEASRPFWDIRTQ